MKSLRYLSGDEARAGDRIRLHGEAGIVEFIVSEKVGDPELDWYLVEHPEGGVMITNETFGRVFLSTTYMNEHLEFVARRRQQ
ncbi:MAG TPA: hypothetical protein VGF69_04365 [Thermoanaerobaculia bacterium]